MGSALRFVNGMGPHRCTALYRFDNETLTNLYYYDRESPSVTSLPEMPILASYCSYVQRSGHAFTVCDALNDARTADHPKRFEVQSYCGVPVTNARGRLCGTVCHFDFKIVPICEEDVRLLQALVQLLQQSVSTSYLRRQLKM